MARTVGLKIPEDIAPEELIEKEPEELKEKEPEKKPKKK